MLFIISITLNYKFKVKFLIKKYRLLKKHLNISKTKISQRLTFVAKDSIHFPASDSITFIKICGGLFFYSIFKILFFSFFLYSMTFLANNFHIIHFREMFIEINRCRWRYCIRFIYGVFISSLNFKMILIKSVKSEIVYYANFCISDSKFRNWVLKLFWCWY